MSDHHSIKIVSALAVLALAMTLFVIPADVSDADTSYDVDMGQKWSYSVQFVFTGSNANAIEWDFGDGTVVSGTDTEGSENWSPMHTFPAKGVYYVKQTVTNPNGSSTQTYKVEIMGYPTVTLVYNNGSEDKVIEQSNFGTPAIQPEDPVKENATFTGWYTDAKCTQAYDWTANVNGPITLYAGWDESSADLDILAIALIIIGAIIAIAAFLTFPYAAIIGIVVAVIGIAKFMGVF